MEGIERIGSGEAGVAAWVGILVLNELPSFERHCAASGDAEWQDFLLEERSDIEFLRVAEVGEAEEEAVGDEVTGEVPLENGGLVVCAMVGMADAVCRVGFGGDVAKRQGDLAGLWGLFCLFVNIEEVFWPGWVEVFSDGVLRLPGALEEGVERPVEGGLARSVVVVNEEVTP